MCRAAAAVAGASVLLSMNGVSCSRFEPMGVTLLNIIFLALNSIGNHIMEIKLQPNVTLVCIFSCVLLSHIIQTLQLFKIVILGEFVLMFGHYKTRT